MFLVLSFFFSEIGPCLSILNIKILTSFLQNDLLSFNHFCAPDLALACHGLDTFREIRHLNNFCPPPRFTSSTSLLADSVISISKLLFVTLNLHLANVSCHPCQIDRLLPGHKVVAFQRSLEKRGRWGTTTFWGSFSWKVTRPSSGLDCEAALLFGRVKRVSRECASEQRSREGPAPSLARSREAHFAYPNRRACSQASSGLHGRSNKGLKVSRY